MLRTEWGFDRTLPLYCLAILYSPFHLASTEISSTYLHSARSFFVPSIFVAFAFVVNTNTYFALSLT